RRVWPPVGVCRSRGLVRRTWNKMSAGGVHQVLCLHASPLGYLPEDNTSKPPRDSSRIPLWLLFDGVQDPMNVLHIFLGCPMTPVLSKASTGLMTRVCSVQVKVAQAENSHVPVMKCSNFQMTKPRLLLMVKSFLSFSLCALLTVLPRRDLHPGLVSNPSMSLWYGIPLVPQHSSSLKNKRDVKLNILNKTINATI
uniref:Uncharacterized protein n=1 Tax=Oncorhynchus tshawytscha TaxID=74940 RepID=A0AAZ3S098_ONCTS